MKTLKRLGVYLSLCTMLFHGNVFATKEIKIAFIGLLGSGKTALRAVATNNQFDFLHRKGTRAADSYSNNLRYFKEDIKCTLIDTSGDDNVRNPIITHRLKDVDIAVLTIDASENEFHMVFKQNFVEWIGAINKVHPSLPIILVATKIDIGVNVDELYKSVVLLKEAYKPIEAFECVTVSAKNRQNIGSLVDSDDMGENFWGKVRYLIDKHDILDKKPDISDEFIVYKNAPDDPSKESGLCTIL